jgi:hypothetical protein
VQPLQNFLKKMPNAYKEYRAFIDKISPFIKGLLDTLPSDLENLGGKQLWALAKKGVVAEKAW